MSDMVDKSSRNTPSFALRTASFEDYRFTKALYIATMKPLLTNLDAWDQEDAVAKFKSYFNPNEIEIIACGGNDIGFIHVVRNNDGFSIDQIHIEQAYCSRGIGTTLIVDLQRQAKQSKLPITLSVVKHNRAQSLYERLGFHVISTDATRIHMRCDF